MFVSLRQIPVALQPEAESASPRLQGWLAPPDPGWVLVGTLSPAPPRPARRPSGRQTARPLRRTAQAWGTCVQHRPPCQTESPTTSTRSTRPTRPTAHWACAHFLPKDIAEVYVGGVVSGRRAPLLLEASSEALAPFAALLLRVACARQRSGDGLRYLSRCPTLVRLKLPWYGISEGTRKHQASFSVASAVPLRVPSVPTPPTTTTTTTTV